MWFSLTLALLLPLTLLRPKAALLVVLFLLPFMPRYLGIGVGDEGFALSPRRIAFLAFGVGLMVQAVLREDILNRALLLLSQNRLLLGLIGLGVAVRLLSTISNSGFNLQLLYVLDDMIVTLVPAIGVLCLVHSADDERRVLVVILTALLVSSVLALLEVAKGGMILQGLVSVSVEEAGRSGLTDIFRGDDYRAKALFDNPLLLAEFACVVWPWAVYLYYAGVSDKQRFFALCVGMSAIIVVYVTHARSGWLVLVLGAAGFIALRGWDRSSRIARGPLVAVFAVVFCVIGLAAFQLVSEALATAGVGIQGAKSIIERLNQYVVVAAALSESPLLGYGMSRNILTNLESLDHLDNFWLRLSLEGGLFLLASFVLLSIVALVMIFRARGSAYSRNYRMFMTAALVSTLSFLAYKSFVSMPTNNALFFVVVVLVMRRNFWSNLGNTYARPSLSQ